MKTVSFEIPWVEADRAKVAAAEDGITVLFGVATAQGAVPQCQVTMTPALARELRAALLAVLER